MSFCSFCFFFRVVVGKYYYTILRSDSGGTGSEVVAHEFWVAKPERTSAIRLVEPFVEKRVIVLALRVRDGASRAGAIMADVAVHARPARHILNLSAKLHYVSCRSFTTIQSLVFGASLVAGVRFTVRVPFWNFTVHHFFDSFVVFRHVIIIQSWVLGYLILYSSPINSSQYSRAIIIADP